MNVMAQTVPGDALHAQTRAREHALRCAAPLTRDDDALARGEARTCMPPCSGPQT